jgi:hypothetical protein
LFTDRAITYCDSQKIRHAEVAVSAGVQRMVRSDRADVMFTLDTETGVPDVVLTWGLGEFVVQGITDPDEYLVCKPRLANQRLISVVERRRGLKLKKLLYGCGSNVIRPLRTSRRERDAGAERQGNPHACALGGGHRASLRPPDGHALSTACRYSGKVASNSSFAALRLNHNVPPSNSGCASPTPKFQNWLFVLKRLSTCALLPP